MADKKLTKRKRKNQTDEDVLLTKDEEEVAKYLRFNLESKKSTLLGDEAYYFFGSKAVDFLMDSKWASSSKSTVVFTHRESVVAFLNRLLGNRYFDHVHVIKTEKKVKKKDGDKKKDENEKKEDGDKKKEGDKKKSDKTKSDDKEKDEKKTPGSPKGKKDKDGKEVKKVKKKVKINLEPHEEQIFYDGDDEAYVWIYDPVSWKTLFFGVLLVLAIIAVCLFPLWPENVREYSWYLSVAGAIFVGGILVLAVLRYIFYGLVWLCTLGKLHFWLLPNLTAECGFFESFVPAYEYTVIKTEKEEKEERKSKKKEKAACEAGNEGSTLENGDSTVASGKDSSITCGSEGKLEHSDDGNEHCKIEEIVDNVQPGITTGGNMTEDNIIESITTETIESISTETIESISTETMEIISSETGKSISSENINDDVRICSDESVQDIPPVVDITDDLTYVDKLENESEESNGSTKEEDWVKVKKVDADGSTQDCKKENESEVKC